MKLKIKNLRIGELENIIQRLNEFIEHEMRSCSMDIGGITPEYVYRMWGGAVAIEDIEKTLRAFRKS